MRIGRILFLLVAVALLLGSCQRVHAEEQVSARFVDELTFLGDSITAHMATRAEVSPQQLWCSKERYLNLDARIMRARVLAPDTGEAELITQLAGRLQPRYLVITLGIDYGVYYYSTLPTDSPPRHEAPIGYQDSRVLVALRSRGSRRWHCRSFHL